MNMSIFRKRFLMVLLSIIITHTVMARPLDNPYYVILITLPEDWNVIHRL